MNPTTANLFIKAHTLLAGFFLPAAIVFAVTGGLYTWGIKGDYKSQSKTLAIALPATPNLAEAKAAAVAIIPAEFQGEAPSGGASIKTIGSYWSFEWSGSQADFTLESTSTAGQVKATYKETSLHRFFVQLHKAKGGTPFKFMAAGLALAFIFLFTSGVLISLSRPPLRKLLFVSLALGTLSFVAMALTS